VRPESKPIEWAIESLDAPERLAGWEALQAACEGEAGVAAGFLVMLARHGGKVLGVVSESGLRAAAVALLGDDSRSDRRIVQARLKLHLALLLVHPAWRRRGMATALMLSLRRAAEVDGLPLITWELDPLDSRTAALSFHRLGATSSGWVDPRPTTVVNGGPARRIEVDWWLNSQRVHSRAGARRQALGLAHYLEAGAQQVNPAGLNHAGMPTPSNTVEAPSRPLALLEVPADTVAFMGRDPSLAAAWRNQVCELLEGAFAQGYLLTDFLTLEQEAFPRAFYVLAAGDSTLG
jgi:predicted GNAT superfamily acetyltransferase